MALDIWSAIPLCVEIYFEELCLATATGFTIEHKGKNYLVTNKHVFSGRNVINGDILSTKLALPNRLKVWFHGMQPGLWFYYNLNLFDSQGNALWIEHPDPTYDIAALELPTQEKVKYYHLPLELAEYDMYLEVGDVISVVGFPHGAISDGRFPIWKTGHIASELDLFFEGLPIFYIDATTKGGMSGSPVIAKRTSGFRTGDGSSISLNGRGVCFLGIYSGRNRDIENDIEVGRVWRPLVIKQLLSSI